MESWRLLIRLIRVRRNAARGRGRHASARLTGPVRWRGLRLRLTVIRHPVQFNLVVNDGHRREIRLHFSVHQRLLVQLFARLIAHRFGWSAGAPNLSDRCAIWAAGLKLLFICKVKIAYVVVQEIRIVRGARKSQNRPNNPSDHPQLFEIEQLVTISGIGFVREYQIFSQDGVDG